MKVRLWCLSLFAAAAAPLLSAQEWPQWALNAQHNTQVGIAGQSLAHNIVNLVYDPLVPQEQAATGGDLLAHYQAPLVDGNDTYMMFKLASPVIHLPFCPDTVNSPRKLCCYTWDNLPYFVQCSETPVTTEKLYWTV